MLWHDIKLLGARLVRLADVEHRDAATRRVDAPRPTTGTGTMTGTIAGLRPGGFGFIAADGGTGRGDLYFHRTAVAGGGFDQLREAQRVSYEQEAHPRDRNRQRAVRVTPLAAAGSPVLPGTA